MTRLGWTILAIILVAAIGFGSMVQIGGSGSAGHRARARVEAIFRPIPLATPAPHPGLLAVPVAGVPRTALADSWGEARGGGMRAHHGTDVIAPAGAPVVAAAPGRIEKLFKSALGGITLYERSADRRWLYYYAHLAGYAPGVHEGQVVRPGQPLGFVGDTGDAGPGNYHLHLACRGWRRTDTGGRGRMSIPSRCLPDGRRGARSRGIRGVPQSPACSLSRQAFHEDQRRRHPSGQHHRV